jgi:dienelactone hydrolase
MPDREHEKGPALSAASPVAHHWDGETTMKGFVVYDAIKAKRPGIVLVHEWWGITSVTARIVLEPVV